MALRRGAEGAMLAVERPPAGGWARVRGVSPGSGRTACSQCGPAPPALQAVGCLALPGTKRVPQMSPPVLKMLVWKEKGEDQRQAEHEHVHGVAWKESRPVAQPLPRQTL